MADPLSDDVAGLQHRGDEPHLLREVFRTYQVLMSGFARATGMPSSRFVLMRLLANVEGDVGVTDLARRLGINPAAVTRLVQELEAEHLVKRRADPRDGSGAVLRWCIKRPRDVQHWHDAIRVASCSGLYSSLAGHLSFAHRIGAWVADAAGLMSAMELRFVRGARTPEVGRR